MRFRDFGCEPGFVELNKGDIAVTTTVANTEADREVSKLANKSHLSPWMTVPEFSSNPNTECHFFTIWKGFVIVGEIIFWGFTESDDDKYSCFISYWVDRNYINKGIGTTAVALSTMHAFENLEVDRVEAAIQPDNFASIRLAEKLGFKKVTTVDDVFRVGGVRVPHDIYALDRY